MAVKTSYDIFSYVMFNKVLKTLSSSQIHVIPFMNVSIINLYIKSVPIWHLLLTDLSILIITDGVK